MNWTGTQKEEAEKLRRSGTELAELLGWPFYENISWFQVWPGGWCLHGRPAVLTGPSDQSSMNFEVTPVNPHAALRAAIQKVKDNPDRLKEQVRWFCPEHGWEEVVPRGEMHSGCPQCGGYYCEPWLGEAEE